MAEARISHRAFSTSRFFFSYQRIHPSRSNIYPSNKSSLVSTKPQPVHPPSLPPSFFPLNIVLTYPALPHLHFELPLPIPHHPSPLQIPLTPLSRKNSNPTMRSFTTSLVFVSLLLFLHPSTTHPLPHHGPARIAKNTTTTPYAHAPAVCRAQLFPPKEGCPAPRAAGPAPGVNAMAGREAKGEGDVEGKRDSIFVGWHDPPVSDEGNKISFGHDHRPLPGEDERGRKVKGEEKGKGKKKGKKGGRLGGRLLG